jgi:uncharacterized protein
MPRFRRPARTIEAPRTRAAPFRCRLVVMAKVPAAGRVKTRLAGEIGIGMATAFARHAIGVTLARLANPGAWQMTLALAPDCAADRSPGPAGITRVGQGAGDLGRRMQRIMNRMPPGPVVIVGTDIPELRASHIRQAFRLLGRHDAVFGPASDGGYWLVGLRRRPRILRLFAGVRWSSPHALADTLANLDGLAIARLETLSDVDDKETWACSARTRARLIVGTRQNSSVSR